jgi:hypothetical protein
MKANQVAAFLGVSVGIGILLWLNLRQRRDIAHDVESKISQVTEAQGPTNALRLTNLTSFTSNSNESLRKPPSLESALSDSAIRDGDHILSIGVPDFQSAYRKLTNSGVEPNQAKTLLRPVLWHLSYIATCNRVISDGDHSEYEFLERIRQDTSRTVEDRESTMDLLAITNRQFRENWMAKRQARMEAFSQLVADLKVNHPEELLRDLLLIQPSFPPPDPPPP